MARYFQLDWQTVKAVEKAHLKRKYQTIPLVDVTVLGIDECYVGRGNEKKAFHGNPRSIPLCAILILHSLCLNCWRRLPGYCELVSCSYWRGMCSFIGTMYRKGGK